MKDKIDLLKKYINSSKYTIVVTGAGISVSSGINVFLRTNMIYGAEICSKFILTKFPKHYYKVLRKSFLNAVFSNGPSITHKKIAELEKKGLINGIVTTNIDNLHTIAGNKNVAEMQGSFGLNKCLKCNTEYNDINIWNNGEVPRCNKCDGIIAPYTVYKKVFIAENEKKKAIQYFSKADLIIVVGTNTYYRDYIKLIKKNCKIININPNKAPMEKVACLNIKANADDVFKLL